MVDKTYFSGKILEEPKITSEEESKGAIILSQVDTLIEYFPKIKDYFYIIERRGWRGINESVYADIKLVEDLSTWDDTKKRFPNAILLDIGPADFIDTESFFPMNIKKEYCGIQVSSWDRFKRPYLFIQGAALLPQERFLKLGHFVGGGDLEEISLRDDCIKESKRLSAQIDYPFASLDSNKKMPRNKDAINQYINKSKVGILTTKVEGINRFKMECLSSGIPMLVPADTSYPTKKHINDKTGYLFEPTPEGLSKAIVEVLNNLNEFSPREYILANTGILKSLSKLKEGLRQLCKRDKNEFHFENIYWDGRNQSLDWGNDLLNKLNAYSLRLR